MLRVTRNPLFAARNALQGTPRKVWSQVPSKSTHAQPKTVTAGFNKRTYSTVMTGGSGRGYRSNGRGGNGMHWSAIGALTAVLLASSRQAQCEHNIIAPPVIVAVPLAPSKSLLRQLKQKIADIWRAIRERFHKWWRMLVRTGTLATIFVPVFSTLPIAMTFQYSQFINAAENIDFWWWRALRMAIRASGPCTIKLAQWMATRPDLFPFCVCRNLQELQIDASPPKAAQALWGETEAAITEAVGPHWKQLFRIHGDKLLGSGCVAQVHLGHVIATQQPIAVKVIHKNVADTIATDIEIMLWLTEWLELIPGVSNLSMTEIVEEFSILMLSQLDLRREAEALMKFRKNFGCDTNENTFGSSGDSGTWDGFANKAYITNKVAVTFPMPLPGFAFENVLFETFEDGEVISKYLDPRVRFPLETAEEHQHISKHTIQDVDAATLHALATAGVDVMLKMIFEDNFLHADLHSGNIIVRNMRTTAQEGASSTTKRQGEGLVVSMIDAGLTAELNDEDRRNFLDLFAALVRNDGRHIGRLMIERNSKNSSRGVPISQAQSENFQNRMHEVVSSVHESGLALGRMSICDLLQKVLIACYESNVKLDSKFVSIMLALGVMEGMGRRLDPDVDLLKAAAPQVLKASAKFGLYYAAQKLREAQKQHASRHPTRASLKGLAASGTKSEA